MNTATFRDVLGRHNITVPDETIAEITVPVLSGSQRQGDIAIFPRKPLTLAERSMAVRVLREGIAVVRGESGGNTHMLSADGDVLWLEKSAGLLLGVIEVAPSATGYLIHTDEHGANGVAPGCYRIHGKREQADERRRVAD